MSGRQVVVLRAGPAKGRGLVLDIILGILGFAILASTVYLVQELPEEDIIENQYRVEFPTLSAELFGLTCGGAPCEVTEGRANQVSVALELPDDNVFEIAVELTIEDNIEESLPDAFAVELVAPNGTALTLPVQLTDARNIACPTPPTSTDYCTYTADASPGRTYRFVFGGKPEPFIVQSANLTADEVTANVAFANTVATAGTWTVNVWLEDAGDCPAATVDQTRYSYCQAATNGSGVDTTSMLSVSRVTYAYYDIVVSDG